MSPAVIDTLPLLLVHIPPPPAVIFAVLIVMLVARVCAFAAVPAVRATRIA